jgi:localization factor PodJL
VRSKRRSVRDDEADDEIGASEHLAAVHDRLDELTRQIERVANGRDDRRHDEPRRNERPRDEQTPDHISDALARLDRRLEQIIAEGRASAIDAERRSRMAPPPQAYAPPPPPSQPAAPSGPAKWAAEISARQRMLDGGAAPAATASHATAPAPAIPGQDLTGLEHQLRAITSQIASLHQPYEDALSALRSDLAEVGRALADAMPRRAVEALESEVRKLADRIDRSRGTGGGNATSLTSLEQGLAEVRDALQHLAPAENLVGFEEAVRGLSRKIDQLGSVQQDPSAFHQLEQAIAQMRGIVSHVASDDALAQLAAKVYSLAARFEQLASESSHDALHHLESRIAALVDSGRAVPPELEASIRSLSERLDRMQLSQGDQLALGSLEDRIVKLAEKLDAFDARLNNLGSIERGISDLMVMLGEMRNAEARSAKAAAEAPASPAPTPPPSQPHTVVLALTPPTPPALPAPEPAAIEPTRDAASPPSKPAPQRPQPRRPIDPDLPPDTPLEPGAGMPRVKPGSPAARIAASEAALRGAMPAAASLAGKSAAITAARNAAISAYNAASDVEPKAKRTWFKLWPKRKAKAAPPPPGPALKSAAMPAPAPASELAPLAAAEPPPVILTEADLSQPAAEAKPARSGIFRHVKTLLIAACVVIIVLGALQAAIDFFLPEEAPEAPAATAPSAPPAPSAPSTRPSRPMPPPGAEQAPAPPPTPMPVPDTTGQINRSFFEPSTVVKPKLPLVDVTGSIARRPPAASPAPHSPTADQALAALPTSIGPVLRAAAGNHNPGAEYEISLRYFDGRGVPRSIPDAVFWLERAAKAGFAPAQFRLGSLNEKGDGVKKDLGNARRLYLAAANQGHAKAMHNLAVLYAEGIDGKPDYKAAAQWFRKAAIHGVPDSQYNLAILYARGIGIEQNLAESYRWFALASTKGDQDAAKKRDEVASRLDQQSLVAAKLAVQTFTAEPEPDAAINLKAPHGGWDQAAVTAQPPRSKPRTVAPANP